MVAPLIKKEPHLRAQAGSLFRSSRNNRTLDAIWHLASFQQDAPPRLPRRQRCLARQNEYHGAKLYNGAG